MSPGKEANRRAAKELEILARVVKRKSRRMNERNDVDLPFMDGERGPGGNDVLLDRHPGVWAGYH
jgi:hypothetical protein